MKKIINNKISNLIKVLVAVLALFLFNIDAKAEVTFTQNYDYTGGEQVLTVPYSGIYKLETWGAQGGAISPPEQFYNVGLKTGGYGGFSTGLVQLQQNQKIYINVGQRGADSPTEYGGCSQTEAALTSTRDSYNGGGVGMSNCNTKWGGGGGATHIATSSGLLSTLSSKTNSIIIVAAGGGGAGSYGDGGSGGGFIGLNGIVGHDQNISPAGGGTQTEGGNPTPTAGAGSFGKGGTGVGAGGGSGYYGGGSGWGGGSSAGGGSGYIANTLLTDKHMTCYGCTTSNAESTKTLATTLHSATPITDQAKEGNGYAKISLVKVYAYLSNLTVNKGTIEENFETNKFDYTWIIPKGVNELTDEDINVTPNDPTSTVIVPERVPFTQDGDTFEITVITDDTDRNTYTLTMQRYVSNDGRLASITSDKGQFREAFEPDTKDYTLEIFEDVDTVTLDATPFEQDNQGITGLGEITLNDYEQDTQITSTAEDGTIEVYNVHIIKDMYLKNITIEGLENVDCGDDQCELVPSFTPEVENYTITVPYEYDKLRMSHTISHDGLEVGRRVNSVNYSPNMTLPNINNTIKFNIYGVNNINSIIKTYTVTLIREKDEGKLKSLNVNKGRLVETFKGNKYNYTWIIPKGTTILTKNDVKATLTDDKSELIVPNSVQYTQNGDTFEVSVRSANLEEFNYNGEEQVFVAPVTGTYKLETWGAQGGAISPPEQFYNVGLKTGGYGGYSSGIIQLSKNQVLYINVGQRGADSPTEYGGCSQTEAALTSTRDSYNGGGVGMSNCNTKWGGGGGATHIATSSGLLSTLSSKTNSIIIVAAGGGGAGSYGDGGSGGGFIGLNGILGVNESGSPAGGGTQTEGGNPTPTAGAGSFGKGGTGVGAGGGSGYYGGGSGWGGGSSAGGGSGYIANTLLTDKHMTCYNCTTSNNESIKTLATTLHSATPIADQAKEGNGFAKITMLDADQLTRTYTLTLEMEKSDDARLATLTATTPTSEPNFPNGFDKDQTDPVIIEVYNNVFEITLDGTPYEQDATVIDGLGTIELNEDEVEHNITVQAENGDIRVYQVIIRKNMYIEDMGLTSTSLEGKACKAGECVLEPTFDPGTTEYFIKVPVDYDNLYAYYSLPDTHHTSVMTVDGNPYVDGYELPVEGTVVVKVDVYNDDPNNNQVVKTYTMRVIKEVEYQQEFDYTGDYQVFIAPFTGKYKMETWGASGADLSSVSGGKGAYASGYIELQKGEKLYVYVGEGGINARTTRSYGELSFNGGSGGNYACVNIQPNSPYNFYGGSATDIRLKPGDSATDWDNQASLASRIMVASGGSASNGSTTGAPGGTINGIAGSGGTTGGTQTSSGGPKTGGFGYAGTPSYNPVCDNSVTSGAGSGYYGGGATNKTGVHFGNNVSASGSSFISGYPGVIAITSEDDLTPKTGDDKNIHYSGKRFENAIMLAGNEEMPTHDGTGTITGNSGDGYAKITYIPEDENRVDFDYTGDYQVFIAPFTGKYKMETWGAQGANLSSVSGGKGAYASGYIDLHKDEILYIYVGEGGINALATRSYGELSFNGGSGGNYACVNTQPNAPYNSYGGSATDIRLVEGNWNSFDSLKSRIMVASGGSASNGATTGAPGGTINGIAGSGGTTGGTQTSSGGPKTGGFGYAGTPSYNPVCDNSVTSGAGSGYYGGGATNKTGGHFGNNVSASGSSFISGHPGVNAIAENSTESNIIHTGQANHYSGKVFTDTVMKAGNEIMPSPDGVTTMVGNSGDGHAAITLIEVEVKLDDLTVDYGALTESFDKDKNDYVWQIPKDTEYIDKEDIHYVPSNPDSTVTDTLPIDEVHNGDVIEITVTGDDGVTTNVYTLTVEYIKDTDNRLRTLESDKGVFTPEFNPDTNSYVLEIYEYLDEVTLTGEPMSEYSTVVGLGTIDMEEDIVEHEIIVTAEDGSINIYNVTIKKDAYLLYLGLNGLDQVPCVEDECTLVPPFEPSSNEYSIKVPYEYETLDVYYLTSTPEHSVKIKVNDSEVSNYSLPEGDTLVTIELYNKNNILVNTYTMNVNRAKGNYATLDNLEVSTGDLNISFDRETTEYTWIIPFDVNNNLENYLTYSTTDPGATAELIPSTINYTGDGQTFDIKVTAEDGVTTKTYTITLQQDIIEDIEVEENMFITVGETKNLYINGLPDGCVGKYLYEVDQSAIIYVYDNGDVYGIFPGEADITISVKNHPEITPKVVHVTVVSDKITSSILDVLDKNLARIIIGEEPGVNISDFLDKLDNPREYLEVYDKDDNLISSDDYESTNVKTGIKVKLVIEGNLHDEAIIIIRGDINEDGNVNVIDKSILSEHLLRLNNIEGYRTYAADIDNNDSINVVDKSKISEYLLRLIDSLNE